QGHNFDLAVLFHEHLTVDIDSGDLFAAERQEKSLWLALVELLGQCQLTLYPLDGERLATQQGNRDGAPAYPAPERGERLLFGPPNVFVPDLRACLPQRRRERIACRVFLRACDNDDLYLYLYGHAPPPPSNGPL